jgi:hypothetical protein
MIILSAGTKKAAILIKSKEHLTEKGLNKIIELKKFYPS